MKIYLVQHGKAKSKEEDPSRSLTEEGIRETEFIADFFKNTKISAIIHSGKKRAEETSEIFGRKMGIEKIKTLDVMNPKDDPEELIKVLEDKAMYIGHLPHLQRIASMLLGGSREDSFIKVKNSGVVCLEKEGEWWSILWYITPELLVQKEV